jgi:carbon storage regulator
MLILSRKINESIIIDDRIVVKITSIDHGTVKLGIQAPVTLKVHRQEVHDAIRGGDPLPSATQVLSAARLPVCSRPSD